MPNKNYINGVYKERKILNEARSHGCIGARSAGSHSPIDLWIIDHPGRTIRLIQCKPDSMPLKTKNRTMRTYEYLNGIYSVKFEVL
jgi:hypothetical protein